MYISCEGKAPLSKKGSAIVEAAIFLPLFFLALLTLVLLIRLIAAQGTLIQICLDEAQQISQEAYLAELPLVPENVDKKALGMISQGTLMHLRIESARNEKKEKLPFSKTGMHRFQYLFSMGGTDALICPKISYSAEFPLPGGFQRTLSFENAFLFRAFVGSEGKSRPMSFEEMEKEERGEKVYVFPKAGERYHKKSCRSISSCPREVILTKKMMRKYEPCSLCHPGEKALGSKICYFPEGGSVYHRMNCSVVKRYIVEMEKEEAIKKGYTPCKICGG